MSYYQETNSLCGKDNYYQIIKLTRLHMSFIHLYIYARIFIYFIELKIFYISS